jgi:hypothetical protein
MANLKIDVKKQVLLQTSDAGVPEGLEKDRGGRTTLLTGTIAGDATL